ncbi:hypothetical protein NHX12_009671 [Muraenolepis orangiensis]|uniref:Uncharacterized protein n=1 Tax=Muraenolepis orangiensis TaxID=630683 RepID=A0A9Q0DIB6_9TELE|nr:hypothetical protein NHX12_009671 [Muraenolepis orangiensis]
MYLISFQTILSDREKSLERAKLALRAIERQMLVQEDDLDRGYCHARELWSCCLTAHKHTAATRLRVDEEEEDARGALAGYDEYRNKMERHRAATALAESQTESHKVLEAQRRRVSALNRRKEELRRDLENPNGKAVQEAKVALETHIFTTKMGAGGGGGGGCVEVDLRCSFWNKGSRRFEAILKRLHGQLNKAQANHRHLSEDIRHMQRQVSEFRRQLNSP